MTGENLSVLLGGVEIGAVRRERNRLSFRYEPGWRVAPERIPLSLCMPLVSGEHGHAPINAFLWGLLPDNERVLDQLGRTFQVSARNPFALIAQIGEDCAGAVQFVRGERLAALTAAAAPMVDWLTEADLERRLRALRQDPARGRDADDVGQFSLAGAQPKTALLFEAGRWGVPSGRTPTTHILKPPTGEFDGHAENEHVCLTLARRLGVPAANTEVRRFGDEVAIVVERYDRVRLGPQRIMRVHQEDMCQALAVPPQRKYQNEGGPSAKSIVDLLRSASSARAEDVATFLDTLVLNWILCGTDAHAKNYAILHAAQGQVRLAPLYDIASALPYDTLDPQKIKLAMAVGGEYRLRDIGQRQWRAFARELGTPDLLDRAIELTHAVAEQMPWVRDHARAAGLDHPIVDRLAVALPERATACRARLEAAE